MLSKCEHRNPFWLLWEGVRPEDTGFPPKIIIVIKTLKLTLKYDFKNPERVIKEHLTSSLYFLATKFLW